MRRVNSVVLIVVDGLRPDGIRKAETPHIDRLIEGGAYTFEARTVVPSITLPCMASMFLGTDPTHHGVTSNTWVEKAHQILSIIDLVRLRGFTTASFYNWEPLRDLSKPGSLNASFFLDNCESPGGDLEIARLAAEYLRRNRTSFAFIYLGYTDTAGHKYGWMTPGYFKAIEDADAAIGKIIEATGAAEETAFIVTSDHGGHGKTHGTEMPEDMIVPWIICGPGVPSNLELGGHVSIIDTAPTIAAILGIEQPEEWTGQVLTEALPES